MELGDLLDRLEAALERADGLEPEARSLLYEILDGVDALHRLALERLSSLVGDQALRAAGDTDPVVDWLLDAYSVGVDERAAALLALEEVAPYVESHGGAIELVHAAGGVVTVRLLGSCAGCSASAVTLQREVEQRLRAGFPGFSRLEVEPDDVPSHPPPVPVNVELKPTRR